MTLLMSASTKCFFKETHTQYFIEMKGVVKYFISRIFRIKIYPIYEKYSIENLYM